MAEIRPAHSYARHIVNQPLSVTGSRYAMAEILQDAVERFARDPRGQVIVIHNGVTEQRAMAYFDETTHRRVPVTAAGERVEYHIDGTTHVVDA